MASRNHVGEWCCTSYMNKPRFASAMRHQVPLLWAVREWDQTSRSIPQNTRKILLSWPDHRSLPRLRPATAQVSPRSTAMESRCSTMRLPVKPVLLLRPSENFLVALTSEWRSSLAAGLLRPRSRWRTLCHLEAPQGPTHPAHRNPWLLLWLLLQ